MNIIFYIILIYAILIIIFSMSFDYNDADYLIILGTKLINNKENLTMLKRINRATLYLNNNPNTLVIVSGGINKNNNISEAEIMKNLLIERKISSERIIIEDKSKNTKENIIYSKAFFKDNSKVLICSSDYHICRAKIIAYMNNLKCKCIFSQSSLIELIFHLLLEEIFIIKDILIK